MMALRRWTLAVLALAGLAGAAAAGDGKSDFAGELAALRKDYDAAQSAWYADKPPRAEKNPVPLFLPRFLELARRAKGTDPGVRAAAFVVQKGNAGTAEQKKASGEALDLALATGMKCPAIGEMAMTVRFYGWGLPEEKVVGALGDILERAEDSGARGQALFHLAVHYAETRKTGPEEKAEKKRALALFAQLAKEYPASPGAKEAPTYVFELEHLQVGMKAPDFEAVDQDGVKFRLSGYRGKVVLLDFWGFW